MRRPLFSAIRSVCAHGIGFCRFPVVHLVWIVVVGVLMVVGVVHYAKLLIPEGFLEVGAGYAAKVTASAIFVSGRSLDSVLGEELAPGSLAERVFRNLLRLEVDSDERTVTARVLGVRRTAVYREGFGCTLAIGHSAEELRAQINGEFEAWHEPRPWAMAENGNGTAFDRTALDAGIDAAFRNEALGTRAVVVVQDGRILAERYAGGYHAGMPLPGWSMSKSVTHALIGIRVLEGHMHPDAPLPLTAWRDAGNPRAAIKLDHMLRMNSGLAWREESPDHVSDTTRMLFREPDMAGFAAKMPADAPPGRRWVYSSGTTNVVCRALRETFATDREYREFPRNALFDPLGMASAVFELDADGTFVGSSYCHATARDWARFGLLYLNDGVVDGRRILPEGWVAGASEPTRGSRRRYGRHFWLPRGDALPPRTFLARGFGGQMLAIVPEHRAVVVRLGHSRSRDAFNSNTFLAPIVKALR